MRSTLLCSFLIDEPRENGEAAVECTDSSTEPLPGTKCQIPDDTDYSRLDSFQACLVYPVKEFDTNTSWHSSLSVSLNHPVFITVSILDAIYL